MPIFWWIIEIIWFIPRWLYELWLQIMMWIWEPLDEICVNIFLWIEENIVDPLLEAIPSPEFECLSWFEYGAGSPIWAMNVLLA